MRLVNTDLLKNPGNWIIVTLMIAFGVVIFSVVNPLRVGS
jgi:hypothetical protein